MSNQPPANDRRVGASRLSTWSGRRIGMLWLQWPASILAICIVAVLASIRLQGSFTEVRVALSRTNLIALPLVLIVPPACLTAVWWRMRGRRRSGTSH
ncbi:MAG TPA: hypothetical protein VJN70_09500 [Gemmatimonadaceae bacterium]|nr:hypothetical protein [Gemmatimonadaceae bacterium]